MYSNEYPDAWTYENETPTAPRNDPYHEDPTIAVAGVPPFPAPPKREGKQSSRRFLIIFSLIALLALVGGGVASASGAGTTLLHLLSPTHAEPSRIQQPATTGTPQPSTGQKQIGGTNNQSSQPALLPQSLSPQWLASGHTLADAAAAAVIAQGFVLRYQSIDGTTPASLTAAQTSPTNFLTKNARLRYLGEAAGFPPDPHDTTAFAQQFQAGSANHMGISSEQAIVDGPPQVQPFAGNGVFSARVTIPYQMIITNNGDIQTSHQQMTILLVPVPKNGLSVPNLLGWGVTSYTAGTMPPLLPAQP